MQHVASRRRGRARPGPGLRRWRHRVVGQLRQFGVCVQQFSSDGVEQRKLIQRSAEFNRFVLVYCILVNRTVVFLADSELLKQSNLLFFCAAN